MRSPLLAWTISLATIAGCPADPTRRVTLVTTNRAVDEALNQSRQVALEGDLERAELLLRAIVREHPHDPVAPVAQLLLARVVLARGDLHGAERIARAAIVTSDPSLARTQRLILGVAAARARASGDALTLLRPLEGRLPDKAETAELSCALAESEMRAGDPARALRAIALVDQLAKDATAWMPTGLMCEQPETRLALVGQTVTRVQDPAVLAGVLDALPAASTLAAPIAVRLRALAELAHETPRWLSYLRLLPAEAETDTPLVTSTRSPRLTVGVLSPTSGVRSVVGVAMARGAYFGVESLDNVFVVPEHEGDSPEAAVAALDRLVAQNARAVIGISREDFSAPVAVRAQALGVELWLVAPSTGVEAIGAHIHNAGPQVEARARALAQAIRNRGPRATLVVPSAAGEIFERLDHALDEAGVAVSRQRLDEESPRGLDSDGLHVFAGPLGREARAMLGRAAERAPSRWLFEARSGLPGGSGTWVGIRPGPAFETLLPSYCANVGEPPDELALLTFDAVRSAVAFARSASRSDTALAPGFAITVGTVGGSAPSEPNSLPAAARRCPVRPAP